MVFATRHSPGSMAFCVHRAACLPPGARFSLRGYAQQSSPAVNHPAADRAFIPAETTAEKFYAQGVRAMEKGDVEAAEKAFAKARQGGSFQPRIRRSIRRSPTSTASPNWSRMRTRRGSWAIRKWPGPNSPRRSPSTRRILWSRSISTIWPNLAGPRRQTIPVSQPSRRRSC